jgi:hypothetical protein
MNGLVDRSTSFVNALAVLADTVIFEALMVTISLGPKIFQGEKYEIFAVYVVFIVGPPAVGGIRTGYL